MIAVILAGGLGSRLRPFTSIIPKPLLPVGESSVLDIQLSSLKRHGVSKVYIATNYHSDVVMAYISNKSYLGLEVEFSKEEKPLGTCGPLSLLRERLTEPFVLMNGDILTTLNFRRAYDFAMGLDAELTVVTKELVTPFAFGKVLTTGDYICDVQEKPDVTLEILAGIYVIKPSLIDSIPHNEYYNIDSLIRLLIATNRPVGRYLMPDYWLDIGTAAHYEVAQDAYREHFQSLKAPGPGIGLAEHE